MRPVLFRYTVSVPPQGLGISPACGAHLSSPPGRAGPQASPSCGSSLPVELALFQPVARSVRLQWRSLADDVMNTVSLLGEGMWVCFPAACVRFLPLGLW